MNDTERFKCAYDVLITVERMNDAIQFVGGVPLTMEQIKKMTLLEFIVHYAAPNGLRIIDLEPKKVAKK